ncbi:GNAT family N-acetyltransferase [Cohnella cholangitidis]|uniref:GNAT family N-acetyltransferase n=1 Tax=Cohnella cholangitidis TaxID=2598458 RepID=A0A7G5BSE7_9BACL|nr:GNAT family protein [Cohnella cholangitidis]QMV39881.1 GNAT family N-acetyltransferase [Cohnella cholangitidis]
MNIRTRRLSIRSFKNEDWQAVLGYSSDKQVMKYMPAEAFTEKAAKEFVARQSGIHAENYAVVLNEGNILIGHMVFHKWFGEHTYEIGWVFNRDYHNKGYASEAAQAILNYGFEELKLHRIIATCQPENTASYRVMEKCGMRREGFFRKCILKDAEWRDEYFYAILEEEWMSRSS